MSSTHRQITLFAGLALLVFFLGLIVLPVKPPSQVVVNMPADAKPLAALTPVVSPNAKVIAEERAVLYWTIYHASLERSGNATWATEAATAAAKEAVDKVYGPSPRSGP